MVVRKPPGKNKEPVVESKGQVRHSSIIDEDPVVTC